MHISPQVPETEWQNAFSAVEENPSFFPHDKWGTDLPYSYACILLLVLPWILMSLEFLQVEKEGSILLPSISLMWSLCNLYSPQRFIFGYFSGFMPLTIIRQQNSSACTFYICSSWVSVSFMSLETFSFRRTLVFHPTLCMSVYLNSFFFVAD